MLQQEKAKEESYSDEPPLGRNVGNFVLLNSGQGHPSPPKPMMHIPYSPHFRKIYKFSLFPQIF